jgi:hypothetical protein
MRICFNAININLGNTGGCLSIAESMEILCNMGHKVCVSATKNRMTWKRVKALSYVPKADVCISVSIMDLDSTRKADAGKKVLWLRGPEWCWMMPKESLMPKLERFVNEGGKILCNSQWLTLKMIKWGFQAKTCYVGLDLNRFKDFGNKPQHLTIGCLYSKRDSKNFKDFVTLQGMLGSEDIEYMVLGGHNEVHGDNLPVFFNQCRVWFAPSKLEGFHRVPCEAALCGSWVVANDDFHGGTGDWLYSGISGYRYHNVLDAATAIRAANINTVSPMIDTAKETLTNVIGSKETCMKRLLEAIYDD